MKTFTYFSLWFAIALVGMVLVAFGTTGCDMRLVQALSTIAGFIVPTLIVLYLTRPTHTDYHPLNSTDALITIGVTICCIPLINVLSYWNHLLPLGTWVEVMETRMTVLTEQLLRCDSIGTLGLNILVLALLPAVGEELTFRRLFLRFTPTRWGAGRIWFLAFIFAVAHVQFLGFIPRMLLGALLGYLYVWSGNIWLSVLCHFTNNAVAVISYYFFADSLDSLGTGGTWWLAVLGTLLVGLGIFILYKRKKNSTFASL